MPCAKPLLSNVKIRAVFCPVQSTELLALCTKGVAFSWLALGLHVCSHPKGSLFQFTQECCRLAGWLTVGRADRATEEGARPDLKMTSALWNAGP